MHISYFVQLLILLGIRVAKFFLCLVFAHYSSPDLGWRGLSLQCVQIPVLRAQLPSLLTPTQGTHSGGDWLLSALCPLVLGSWGPHWCLCVGSLFAESNVLCWFSPLFWWSAFSTSILRNVLLGKCFESLCIQKWATPPSHLIDSLVRDSWLSDFAAITHCLLDHRAAMEESDAIFFCLPSWEVSFLSELFQDFLLILAVLWYGFYVTCGTQWLLSKWRLMIVCHNVVTFLLLFSTYPSPWYIFSVLYSKLFCFSIINLLCWFSNFYSFPLFCLFVCICFWKLSLNLVIKASFMLLFWIAIILISKDTFKILNDPFKINFVTVS